DLWDQPPGALAPARVRFSNDGTVPAVLRWRCGEVRRSCPRGRCDPACGSGRCPRKGARTGPLQPPGTRGLAAPAAGGTVLLSTETPDLGTGYGIRIENRALRSRRLPNTAAAGPLPRPGALVAGSPHGPCGPGS